MKNTQNKTIELYSRNNPFYWDVEKFVTEQGYQNVCDYCANVLNKLGSTKWCKAQATQDMYKQQDRDLNYLCEDTLEYLFNNYYATVKPISKRWNGVYKGELQNVNNISDVLNYNIQTVTIKDNYLEIVTSHHDGYNTYEIYFSDYKLYENESERNYMEYIVNVYDLWQTGNI